MSNHLLSTATDVARTGFRSGHHRLRTPSGHHPGIDAVSGLSMPIDMNRHIGYCPRFPQADAVSPPNRIPRKILD
jgi:hypothetical protein